MYAPVSQCPTVQGTYLHRKLGCQAYCKDDRDVHQELDANECKNPEIAQQRAQVASSSWYPRVSHQRCVRAMRIPRKARSITERNAKQARREPPTSNGGEEHEQQSDA